MKVLWFSNTPANGIRYFDHGSVNGGWLQSLDEILQDKIELHVAFYYPGHFSSFKFKKTTYHPISRKNWKVLSMKALLFNSVIQTDDVDLYMDIVKEVQPDIIHIHGTENPFGYLHANTNIPIVISLQGIVNIIYHKYAVGIEDKYLQTSAKSIMHGVKNYFLVKNFFELKKGMSHMKSRETAILNKANNIIGRTAWDRRVAGLLAPQSKYFHNNEMLRSLFYVNEWHPKDLLNRFIIFTTSSNSPFKGLETICKTVDLLNKCGVNAEWRVAGIASEDLIVKIVKRKLKQDFPSKNLVLLGNQPERSIIANLLDADLYVMASHIENSPNNLCEAMILGIPCLATYAGGTNSILEDNISGILVQDGDPWVMGGAIMEIMQNYSEAVKMGKKAREIALNRHDRDKNIRVLISIYSSIIDQFK